MITTMMNNKKIQFWMTFMPNQMNLERVKMNQKLSLDEKGRDTDQFD